MTSIEHDGKGTDQPNGVGMDIPRFAFTTTATIKGSDTLDLLMILCWSDHVGISAGEWIGAWSSDYTRHDDGRQLVLCLSLLRCLHVDSCCLEARYDTV